MNFLRVKKIINQSISIFNLNLSGFTILTETATGYYMLTPIIAALAGADNVLALTRDSEYGKADDVCKETMKLAGIFKVDDKIHVIYDRNDNRIGGADIITNLGFVRPIDSDFLKRVKKTAVIPLMWETWEYRAEDLDLEECRRLQIPVLGTNENHPDLRIFEYIGYIALKLLLEADIEVFHSKIAILGGGEFALYVMNTLKGAKAEVFPIFQSDNSNEKIEEARNTLMYADALVVVEHHNKNQLIGTDGLITVEELLALNPQITVIHICGNVDQNNLLKSGVKCWPSKFAPFGHMSVGTDYVGPKPVIDLHTAGLKVGERLAQARKRCMSALEAELRVLKEMPLAQGFTGYHRIGDSREV